MIYSDTMRTYDVAMTFQNKRDLKFIDYFVAFISSSTLLVSWGKLSFATFSKCRSKLCQVKIIIYEMMQIKSKIMARERERESEKDRKKDI